MHTTKLIAHKGDNRIAIAFEKKQELITPFRKLNDSRRSVTCATTTPTTFGKRNRLTFFQELLGHKNSKTVEIYSYVSTKSLQNIKNPFDDL